MGTVSVIIANFNGKKHLEKCLASLKKQTYSNCEIIVVDNGSTDDSISFIKDNYPDVVVIENKKNLGFAEANNIGYKSAKGDYLLFINNDTEGENCFIEELIKTLKSDKKIGVSFSKLLLMDEPQKYDTFGSYFTKTGFIYHVGYLEEDKGQYDHVKKVFSPKGVSFMVKREVVAKTGLFDSDFFCYFEETDFFWRVWLAGYEILFSPKSVVYHKGSGTSLKLNSDLIDYHSFKNRICALLKNLALGSIILILPIHILLCLLISMMFLILGKLSNAKAIIKAIGWNITNLSLTLEKRKKVQKNIRKIADRELFKVNLKKIPFNYIWNFLKAYLKRW
ncbi:MAG: glycosyltransferase family 2 protein [Candidatus Omnitrophica bacterium]|nr:glycosyltransferase family 2 protein [Candidatus Omnitrophota bacterium]